MCDGTRQSIPLPATETSDESPCEHVRPRRMQHSIFAFFAPKQEVGEPHKDASLREKRARDEAAVATRSGGARRAAQARETHGSPMHNRWRKQAARPQESQVCTDPPTADKEPEHARDALPAASSAAASAETPTLGSERQRATARVVLKLNQAFSRAKGRRTPSPTRPVHAAPLHGAFTDHSRKESIASSEINGERTTMLGA